MALDIDVVVLKAVPAQQFLALREVLPGIDAVRQLVRTIATVVPAAVGQSSVGNMAAIIHSSAYEPDALDLEVGCFLIGKAPETFRLSEERLLTKQLLPAVEILATLVHSGRVEDSHQTYGSLGTWVAHNRFQIAGPGREILMQLPDSAGMAVIELQLPVRRLSEDASAHLVIRA
jgi:effector-binding domain-containing protein